MKRTLRKLALLSMATVLVFTGCKKKIKTVKIALLPISVVQ